MPFTLQDLVEYRWSTDGRFVGKAEVVEVLGGGRYRLERLDGTPLSKEGSIFGEDQLRPVVETPSNAVETSNG